MALFINVDPVPAKWWKRRVYRGWQFGYSGGTENDFMIDVEVAKWRFACYIGFKKVQNWSPGYERHLKWRKEQERARERANRPEPALKRIWRTIRGAKASGYRVDSQRPKDHKTPADSGLKLDAERFIRQCYPPDDDHHERRSELAARPSLPEPIPRDAAAPVEGKLLHEEHQGPAPDHHYQKEPEARGLSKEPTT